MKKCTKCGVEKPLSEFYKQKITIDGFAYHCKPCKNSIITRWKKDNPKKHKIHQKRTVLKRKYNLSIDQFKNMVIAQNNSCAICNIKFKNERSTHVDHCHKTGVIRSLLCGQCNVLLGMAKESINILKSAQKYLEKYNSKDGQKST
jgi:hypothetical protein